MEYISAVVTSVQSGVWYSHLLYETVEVTSEPYLMNDSYSKIPNEHDLFATKQSYIENETRRNGTKTYKCIMRGCLQFQSEDTQGFEF